MGEVLEQENLRKALGRVRRNKGAPGIDGLTSQPPFGVLSELMPAATGRADLITEAQIAFRLGMPSQFRRTSAQKGIELGMNSSGDSSSSCRANLHLKSSIALSASASISERDPTQRSAPISLTKAL